jgi:hypothetical protein
VGLIHWQEPSYPENNGFPWLPLSGAPGFRTPQPSQASWHVTSQNWGRQEVWDLSGGCHWAAHRHFPTSPHLAGEPRATTPSPEAGIPLHVVGGQTWPLLAPPHCPALPIWEVSSVRPCPPTGPATKMSSVPALVLMSLLLESTNPVPSLLLGPSTFHTTEGPLSFVPAPPENSLAWLVVLPHPEKLQHLT